MQPDMRKLRSLAADCAECRRGFHCDECLCCMSEERVAALVGAPTRTVHDLTDSEIVTCWEAGKSESLVFSMLAQADAILLVRSILEGRATVPNTRWMETIQACADRLLSNRGTK